LSHLARLLLLNRADRTGAPLAASNPATTSRMWRHGTSKLDRFRDLEDMHNTTLAYIQTKVRPCSVSLLASI
jgi:hypothetical protein